MKRRLSRWSSDQPVFWPPDRSATNFESFSTSSIGCSASPLTTVVSRVRPSSSRTGESVLSTIVLGDSSVSSASSSTGVSSSMPAVFTCTTSASPQRLAARRAQGGERARRDRLGVGVHQDLVGEYPRVSGADAAILAGPQDDAGQFLLCQKTYSPRATPSRRGSAPPCQPSPAWRTPVKPPS